MSEGLQRSLRGGLGQRSNRGDCAVRPVVGDLPCFLGDRVGGERLHSGFQCLVGAEVGIQQCTNLDSRFVAGGYRAVQQDGRQGGHALAQVGAAGLTAGLAVAHNVNHVVSELECHADQLAVRLDHGDNVFGSARKQGAVLAGCGNQGAGLTLNDRDVVVEQVLALAGAGGLKKLTEHQTFEGLGLNLHGAGAQLGHQQGCAGEDQVAGQNCDGVAPNHLGAVHAAALGGVVHHVVVVEGCQVGQLNDHGSFDDVIVDFAVYSCREQRQQGTHTLAARGEQVAGCNIRQVIGLCDGFCQALLNTREGGKNLRTQLGVCGDEFEACRKLQVEVSQQVGCGNGLLCVAHGVFYLLGVGVFGGV